MQANQPRKPHQPPGWGKLGRDALIYVLVTLTLWGVIAMLDGEKMAIAGGIAYNAILKAWKIIIAVFLVIGLIQVWIPPDKLSKILGKEAGWKGLALASTIPMLIGGSPLTIFPLLKTLRDKGASIAAVMAFIAAWSGKSPLLPLEIKFMGWHFTILRLVLIIPFAVIIGLTSEWARNRRTPNGTYTYTYGFNNLSDTLIFDGLAESVNHSGRNYWRDFVRQLVADFRRAA